MYAVVVADNKLHAAAADVDYKGILTAYIERRFYAHVYELGFTVAGDDGNVYTGKGLYAVYHVVAIAGVAHGAGAEGKYSGNAGLIYRVPEALHGQERSLYSFFGNEALIDAAFAQLYGEAFAIGYMIPAFICFGKKQVKGICTHIDDRDFVLHTAYRGVKIQIPASFR
jgi:hypothetical protein